jgi:hypothetical protein
MTPRKNNLLDHFKALTAATEAAGVEAIMGIKEFAVHLRKGERVATLRPQFIADIEGVTLYVPELTDDATMFAGWLPYQNKRWPLASSKLAFKDYVTGVGLDTPTFTIDRLAVLPNAIVKSDSSSFGANIDGPFRRGSLDVNTGERRAYLESFVEGSITKVWFWDAAPICMEAERMPTLIGDGKSTIQELLQHRFRMIPRLTQQRADILLQKIDTVLAYYGLTRATVLKPRDRQVVDFRYGSDLSVVADRGVFDLLSPQHVERAAQWARIGTTLHQAIPVDIRSGTLFTVDAIVDVDNKIWLLEMNSNPTIHPLCYRSLVSSLFPPQPEANLHHRTLASIFH